MIAPIDPQQSRNKHLVRVPQKHEIHRSCDRRPDLYGDLTMPLTEPQFPVATRLAIRVPMSSRSEETVEWAETWLPTSSWPGVTTRFHKEACRARFTVR